MEEKKKLTQEELFAAEAAFNYASLMGRAILVAAYQINHPDGSSRIEYVTEEDEKEEPEEPGPHPAAAIHSDEGSINDQIEQLTALYTPGVMEFLASSALVEMFRFATSKLNLDSVALAADFLSDDDKRRVAIAWIVSKRVFAVRHPDETVRIIGAADISFGKAKPIPFRPIDNTDRQFISETLDAIDFTMPDAKLLLEKIPMFKQSNVISSPTSLAFWRQAEAAALETSKKTGKKLKLSIPDVYKTPDSVGVDLTISDKDGKPLEISGFDMAIQAAIGQLIRENGNKPFLATPAQVFRKSAGLPPTASVSPASIKATTESINKMRKADASIDFAKQLEAFINQKKQEKQPFFDYKAKSIEGTLISADLIQVAHVAHNGQAVEAVYNFLRAPIIEHYSYGFKQLMEVDKKYLAGALSKSTPENIAFARYILVQINRMLGDKSDKKIPDSKPYSSIPATVLTFKTIAERCSYDISNRSKLRNFQTKVFNYCENLAEMGHIKKVEPYYKNRAYIGVILTL